MTKEENEGGRREDKQPEDARDGEGGNEEERETVCLLLEAVTALLIRSGLFTPRLGLYYIILSLYPFTPHSTRTNRLLPFLAHPSGIFAIRELIL